MKTKQFSDEAEIDFDKSYAYYYEENPNVADIFFKTISLSLENVKQNPFSFPEIHKNVRKYAIKKFPFVIYYQVIESVIRIIAIFHTSRNPEIWNDRV